MSDLLAKFEADCNREGVQPTAALKAGGVHPTLWRKWKAGLLGPTLRNFEAAQRGLSEVVAARKREAAASIRRARAA